MERYRTTGIMVALLIVLGIVAVVLTNNNKGTIAGATPTPVPSFIWQETGTVQGIDVVSGTGKLSLRRDISATKWVIIEPLKYPADSFQIDNIASSLQSLQATKVNTSTGDLSPFGLDKPGITVTITFSGTTPVTHSLLIGGTNFDETATYVKQPGSPDIYLAPTTTIGAIQNWLITPPKEPATPTPAPTIAPTAVATATSQITPAGPVGPPSGASPSPALQASPVLTGTTLAPPTIAVSPPGSGNTTTPLAATTTP